MPKKQNYEYVYNYFKENNCELLETNYINSTTKMKYKCSCGNISTIIWNNFQQGQRCFKCNGKERYNYNYVYDYFKSQDCILLETEYINNKTKMKYKCSCGNISETRFNDFQKSNKCRLCSIENAKIKQKYPPEYVYNYFTEQNCELLESKYINSQTNMKYKCSCGNISYINFSNFKLGQRCKKCGYKKNTGENNVHWNLDRTRKIRTKYLSFDLYKVKMLSNDPNYKFYIKSKKESNNKYQIDHIFPRIAFIDNNLDQIYGISTIKKICNLRENLQIILKENNLSKGPKYNQTQFLEWFNEKIKDYIP